MNKEIREINTNIQTSDRTVEGYAIVFNSRSENLGGFYETILPTAVDEDTIKRSDVFCRFNHNENQVLARCNHGEGSMILTLDERGMKYTFEAPATQLGDELLELLKRGDLSSSSFAFTVAKDGDKWEKRDGQLYRTITKIDKLYDCAPVFTPAYSESTCESTALRFNQIKANSEEVDKMLDVYRKEIQEL